jgi:hypothetical protein
MIIMSNFGQFCNLTLSLWKFLIFLNRFLDSFKLGKFQTQNMKIMAKDKMLPRQG